MERKVSITQIALKPNQEAVTVIQDKRKEPVKEILPYHFRIGNGYYNQRIDVMSIDFIDEIEKMSPQELWFLKLLKDNFLNSGTNHSHIINSKLSSAEQQKLKKGYKRMSEKDLVRRTKREHYMLHPDLIIPINYRDEKEQWEAIR